MPHHCYLLCTEEHGPLMGSLECLAATLAPGTYRALAMCSGDLFESLLVIISEDVHYPVPLNQ